MSTTGNTTGYTDSVYLTSSPFPEIPPSFAAATFQPPPPLEPAEPQPAAFSIELDSSSLVNVQESSLVDVVGGGEGLGSGGYDSVSRKRGRSEDTTEMGVDVSAAPEATKCTDSLLLPPPPPTSSSAKRRRGRPRGSVTKNRAPAAVTAPIRIKTPGVTDACDLRMHKILLSPGEDLSAKLMAFAQHGNRNFYIGSHYGAVSKATLREPSSTVYKTYEGFYQMISFSGSLIQSEAPDGKKAWTGGLTVTLSGSDNSITVGSVAGPLIAATNMQVIVCSFVLPKEEETEPATVKTVNTTKTNGTATGGDGAGMLNVDNSGGDVSESAAAAAAAAVGGDDAAVGGGGVAIGGDGAFIGGDGAGTSIPDNFGMWKDVNDPDTGSMMQY